MTRADLKWTAISYWAGSLLLMAVAAVIYITQKIDDITAAAALLGVLLMVSSVFEYIGVGRSAPDERARKIGTLAATWSWYITVSFTGMLLVFSYWNGREFTTAHLLSTIVFIMTSSMLIINAYFRLKGDVE
jgi:hypothetical protein